MPNSRDIKVWESASFDINGTGDKATFYCHAKVGVREIIIVPTSTDAGGATIKFDGAEQGSSRGDGDVGVITVPASNSQYDVLSEVPSAAEVQIDSGGRIVVEVTAESAAACSTAIAKIRYVEYEDNVSNESNKSSA